MDEADSAGEDLGITAGPVREALAVELARFPKEQRLTLTWERGKEMAEYQQLAEMTGIDIYFGDPSSPWQRGTNENTNRLLRQYLPKKSNLAQHSQTDLDKLAAKLKNCLAKSSVGRPPMKPTLKPSVHLTA